MIALARETYLDALGAAIFAGRLAPSHSWRSPRPLATRRRPTASAALVDLLLDGVAARFTDGYRRRRAAAANARWRCSATTRRIDGDAGSCGGSGWPGSSPASCGTTRCWTSSRHARPTGPRRRARSAILPIALVYRAGVHINAGEFSAAAALIDEADSITAATGHAPLGYASCLLAAWRGDEAER